MEAVVVVESLCVLLGNEVRVYLTRGVQKRRVDRQEPGTMMGVLCAVALYPTCRPFARHMRHRSVPLARSVGHPVAIPLMELSKFR
jgi:hypothetical protein